MKILHSPDAGEGSQVDRNLVAENDELKDKLAVMETRVKNLKEELAIAKQGLGMAHLDNMPKEISDMARARITAGLTPQQAVECAMRQHASDKKHAEESKAAEAAAVPGKTKK